LFVEHQEVIELVNRVDGGMKLDQSKSNHCPKCDGYAEIVRTSTGDYRYCVICSWRSEIGSSS